jgi:lipoprotein-anchoring transpeptidase ErfK/SrfK
MDKYLRTRKAFLRLRESNPHRFSNKRAFARACSTFLLTGSTMPRLPNLCTNRHLPAECGRSLTDRRRRAFRLIIGVLLFVPPLPLRAGVPNNPGSAEVRLGLAEADVLQLAFDQRKVDVLERCWAGGMAVDTPMASGDTLLLAATRHGWVEGVQACLDWCASTEAPGPGGVTALTLAVVTGHTMIMQRLVEAGADANHPLAAPVPLELRQSFTADWFVAQLQHDAGLTPLMLATVLGAEDTVQLMLAHGGRPYQRTKRYTTDAVTLACRAQHIRIGQRLLGRNPDDPDAQEVVIRLSSQRATLFRGRETLLSSQVSTGRKGFATPTGEFLITSKHRQWTSTIYKVPMPYLLRLNGSPIGLHQGAVPGYPASHGCIRLPSGKAAEFFKNTRIGDRVLIRP